MSSLECGSATQIPHYCLAETKDMTPAMRWLESLNVGRAPPARLLPAAVMLRAAALATTKSAELNGFWE
jgi:pyruvate dehydrogenase E2 component (dihydrolipoamide acetyltransferase)